MGKQKDESDSALFIKAMQGVKPLTQDKVPLIQTRPAPIPKQHHLNEDVVSEAMLSDLYEPVDFDTEDNLLFMRPGIQHGVFNKLRRGYFSIEANLDLHGMIVRIARAEVVNFLRDCQSYNIRYARIVHGKGYGSLQKQPVLKGKLNKWLRQCDEVLAFCSARPADGGTGAVYVLIKQY